MSFNIDNMFDNSFDLSKEIDNIFDNNSFDLLKEIGEYLSIKKQLINDFSVIYVATGESKKSVSLKRVANKIDEVIELIEKGKEVIK